MANFPSSARWSSSSALILAIAGILGAPGSAFATTDGSQLLSVAAGVASPSASLAVLENPAGLIYNNGLAAFGYGSTNATTLDTRYAGAGFNYGERSFAVSAGATHYSYRTGAYSSRTLDAVYGVALYFSKLGMAVGFSGGHNLSNGTGISSTAGSGVTAGIIMNPNGKVRLGLTANELLNGGPYIYRAGLAMDMDRNFRFVVDSAYQKTSKAVGVQPGVWVGNSTAAMTLSYGLTFNSNLVSSSLNQGFTGGGSLQLGRDFNVQAYYSQMFSTYTLATTLGF